ncbi:MAG: hypothetical protein K2V38_23335, partial [Gemmataceae bacterium]|nr:hypothetical protein [Gemmataceae bacterium]
PLQHEAHRVEAEIAELRDALDRLHAAMDDLVVRGVRAAGATDIARLTALRDEFNTAGAGHLAEKLSTLVEAIRAGERAAAPALMRAVTTFRLFDRMLTLEVARGVLAPPPMADGDEDAPEDEDE